MKYVQLDEKEHIIQEQTLIWGSQLSKFKQHNYFALRKAELKEILMSDKEELERNWSFGLVIHAEINREVQNCVVEQTVKHVRNKKGQKKKVGRKRGRVAQASMSLNSQ